MIYFLISFILITFLMSFLYFVRLRKDKKQVRYLYTITNLYALAMVLFPPYFFENAWLLSFITYLGLVVMFGGIFISFYSRKKVKIEIEEVEKVRE